MIEASDASAPGLTQRLARRMEALARARREERLRATRADPQRWRMPRLLWPLFTTGE